MRNVLLGTKRRIDMADQPQHQLPSPDPALHRFDRFVGTWSMEGHLPDSDDVVIKGETTFRWLEGGFFLLQDFAMDFMGMQLYSLELIGYDPGTGTFPSTVYANMSPKPLPYRREIDGNAVKISVTYGPMDSTFNGTLSEDGDTFTGGWRSNPG